jgi:putative sigma-54 modulation protein
MNISITFRHMDPSEAIKRYASAKLAKLQRFLRQPMTGKVTVSIDRLKRIVEARISSGGEHLEAKESKDDMYAAIDLVMDKLERQIRAVKGAAESRRRGGDSLKTKPVAAVAASAKPPRPAPKKAAKAKKAKARAKLS